MNSEDFNDAMRRILRPPEPVPVQEPTSPPPQRRVPRSIDAEAGTVPRLRQAPASFNQLIRTATRGRK